MKMSKISFVLLSVVICLSKGEQLVKHKLYYFDTAGRADGIRQMCAYANFDYEDVRISRPQFEEMKEKGKFPFGQVPVLELPNGEIIGQSAAIMRYIAKITSTDLYPEDPIKAATVDSIIDQMGDMYAAITVLRYPGRFGFDTIATDARAVARIRENIGQDVLPRHLRFLDTIMQKSTTGWIADTEGPSIADFILAPRFTDLYNFVNEELMFDILYPFPGLRQMASKLINLPAVACYVNQQCDQSGK